MELLIYTKLQRVYTVDGQSTLVKGYEVTWRHCTVMYVQGIAVQRYYQFKVWECNYITNLRYGSAVFIKMQGFWIQYCYQYKAWKCSFIIHTMYRSAVISSIPCMRVQRYHSHHNAWLKQNMSCSVDSFNVGLEIVHSHWSARAIFPRKSNELT